MNFLVTSFFAELDEPQTLLPSRGLVLDNARTELELAHLTMLLQRAMAIDGTRDRLRMTSLICSRWPDGLDSIRARAEAALEDDQLPDAEGREFIDEVSRAAAPQLVVCRFHEVDAACEPIDVKSLTIEEDAAMRRHGIPFNPMAREIFEIGHLLSLLACDDMPEGALGTSFVLNDSVEWSLQHGDSIGFSVFLQCVFSNRRGSAEGFKFVDLDHYLPRLQSIGRALDIQLNEGAASEPLVYAAQLLAMAAEAQNQKTRLVTLVSILELLLTRNPESSRFNVEDSITKQFVLKIGVLLYHESSSIDMDWTAKAIKDLYAIRSAIAHGDFASAEQHLLKSRFTEPDDLDEVSPAELALDSACEFAYQCVRSAIRAKIEHPSFLTFLKNG